MKKIRKRTEITEYELTHDDVVHAILMLLGLTLQADTRYELHQMMERDYYSRENPSGKYTLTITEEETC